MHGRAKTSGESGRTPVCSISSYTDSTIQVVVSLPRLSAAASGCQQSHLKTDPAPNFQLYSASPHSGRDCRPPVTDLTPVTVDEASLARSIILPLQRPFPRVRASKIVGRLRRKLDDFRIPLYFHQAKEVKSNKNI